MNTPTGRVVPCVLMRAGTSRGPFFLREWLPADERARDEALIGAIGASDLLQLDGVGGGSTLTSKVAIVSPSDQPGCDVDYLFAQVGVGQRSVDTSPNCGNMLAGVGPFAIDQGLVHGRGRHHDGARLQRQHPLAHRRHRADSRPPGHLRRRCADRRSGRHRRADPPELPRRLGRGHRLGLPDRAAHRRHQRRRGHLPRRRHATDDRPSRRPGRHRPRDPRPARRRHHPARTVGVAAAHRRSADGAGRGHRQGHPQTGDRQCWRRTAQHHLALLHPRRCHASHAATGAIGVATAFALPGTVASTRRRPAATGTRDIAVLHPQGRIDVQVELGRDGDQRRHHAGVVGAHRPQDPAGRSPPARLRLLRRWTGCSGRPPGAAAVAPFPNRPVTIIVPTSAGGANDAIARAVARRLGPRLGQTVTVDNRSGAHGSVASEYVARAQPDGHTLLLGYIATHAMNPALQTLAYDPVTDFAPVGLIGHSPTVLVTTASDSGDHRCGTDRPTRRRAEPLPLRLGRRRHRAALRRRTVQAQCPGRDARAHPRRIRTRAQRHRQRTHRGSCSPACSAPNPGSPAGGCGPSPSQARPGCPSSRTYPHCARPASTASKSPSGMRCSRPPHTGTGHRPTERRPERSSRRSGLGPADRGSRCHRRPRQHRPTRHTRHHRTHQMDERRPTREPDTYPTPGARPLADVDPMSVHVGPWCRERAGRFAAPVGVKPNSV